MNDEQMKEGYHLFTEEGWLASFRTNGECRTYLQELLNGRTILGDDYQNADFSVYKGKQWLSIDKRVEVQQKSS